MLYILSRSKPEKRRFIMRETIKKIILPCLFIVFILSLPVSAQKAADNDPVKTEKPVLRMTDLIANEINVTAKDGGKLYAGKDAWVSCRWSRTGPQPPSFRLGLDMDKIPLGPSNGTLMDHTTMGTTLSIPWTAKYGWHTVRCEVDNLKTVLETHENNNIIYKRVFIPKQPFTPIEMKPDLRALKVTIANADNSAQPIKKGKKVKLICKWDRIGGNAVDNWKAQFVVNGVVIKPPGIATEDGTAAEGEYIVYWSFKKIGLNHVRCVLDPTKMVDEISETNNVKVEKITLYL
jgi:hypothetical protein